MSIGNDTDIGLPNYSPFDRPYRSKYNFYEYQFFTGPYHEFEKQVAMYRVNFDYAGFVRSKLVEHLEPLGINLFNPLSEIRSGTIWGISILLPSLGLANLFQFPLSFGPYFTVYAGAYSAYMTITQKTRLFEGLNEYFENKKFCLISKSYNELCGDKVKKTNPSMIMHQNMQKIKNTDKVLSSLDTISFYYAIKYSLFRFKQELITEPVYSGKYETIVKYRAKVDKALSRFNITSFHDLNNVSINLRIFAIAGAMGVIDYSLRYSASREMENELTDFKPPSLID